MAPKKPEPDDHQRLRDALQRCREKYREVFDYANDAIYIHRIDEFGMPGVFVDVNEVACRRLGYSRQEYLEMVPADIDDPEAAGGVSSIMEALHAAGRVTFETVHIAKDGSRIPVEIATHLCTLGGDLHAVSIARDISERKRRQRALEMSQRELALENRIAGVFLTTEGDLIFPEVLEIVLEALESRHGYFGYIDEEGNLACPSMTRGILRRCEIPGKSIVFPKSCWGGIWGRSLAHRQTLYANGGLKLPEGHLQLESALVVPILHKGVLIGQFCVADRPGGYGEEQARLLEMVASRTAPVLKAFLDRRRFEEERRQASEERLRLERQIRQAQKLEAIGTLAGGIAHDFNNVLFPLIVYTEMCIEEVPAQSDMRANLEEILKSAHRARDLVQQILAFSRESESRLRPLKLQPIVKEALKLSRSSLPTTIAIVQEIDENCGPTRADATEIHQICMNLVTNAYHAMQETGGTMTVRLRKRRLTPENAVQPGPVAEDCVVLEVSDTGTGIAPEDLPRIFDPYFTTKEKGKGTGLGLSMTYGIVKRCGGDIRVESRPGSGTTFSIHFPCCGEGRRETERPAETRVSPGGSERILLVDDESSVVRMLTQMLQRLGYTVTPFTSSSEALEAFSNTPHAFDLVITDTTMPELTGDRLAVEMMALRPDLPVIICTGFSEKIGEERARRIGIRGFVQKPVVRSQLAEKIRSALKKDEEGAGHGADPDR